MTLTTSTLLDKREKGAQEATLLRGVLEVTREIYGVSSKAIRPIGGAELELPILLRWRLKHANGFPVGARSAFHVGEGEKS
jgi:hypothetical protein